jgi:hemoglobin/transferrin/lactoferrin receptor protein
MADGARYSRALILSASVFSIALPLSNVVFAQTADKQTASRPSERQKQSRRKPAKPQQDQQAAVSGLNARAQRGGTQVQSLDTITVVASKTEERAIDALAPVSVVTLEQIQGWQPNRLSDVLYRIPGVSGARRRSGNRDQHSRPAGFRPRCRRRRRAAELSAYRP